MRRLGTILVAPVMAGFVYWAFTSSAVRKWWRFRGDRGEVNTYM